MTGHSRYYLLRLVTVISKSALPLVMTREGQVKKRKKEKRENEGTWIRVCVSVAATLENNGRTIRSLLNSHKLDFLSIFFSIYAFQQRERENERKRDFRRFDSLPGESVGRLFTFDPVTFSKNTLTSRFRSYKQESSAYI